MSVARVKTSNALDGMKVEEGNDSLNTFIRQAIGKEPLLSLPRTGDSPVQWIQLLHALDHQGISCVNCGSKIKNLGFALEYWPKKSFDTLKKCGIPSCCVWYLRLKDN